MAHGNNKLVRCVTDGRLYASVGATAKVTGVSPSCISYAIKNKTKSKGKEYRFEEDMWKYGPKMGERISELTAENETLKVKARLWDAYQAELEAARKAEEKRLAEIAKAEEEARKAEAKRQKEKERAKARVERLRLQVERKYNSYHEALNQLNNAEIALEAFDNEMEMEDVA